MAYASDYLAEVGTRIGDASEADLRSVCDQIAYTRDNGARIHLFGNGASMAIALHVATDLTKTCGVIAEAHGNQAWLSMAANDFAWDAWMTVTLQHYANPDDLAVFISSSGMSANVLRGAREAKRLGLGVTTLSGMSPNNTLRELGDVNLWCASPRYNCVEACHLIWLLSVVEELAK